MMQKATKASDNVYYRARIQAAEYNDQLNSREGAAQIVCIERTRLANIELGNISPHPEEVNLMANVAGKAFDLHGSAFQVSWSKPVHPAAA